MQWDSLEQRYKRGNSSKHSALLFLDGLDDLYVRLKALRMSLRQLETATATENNLRMSLVSSYRLDGVETLVQVVQSLIDFPGERVEYRALRRGSQSLLNLCLASVD